MLRRLAGVALAVALLTLAPAAGVPSAEARLMPPVGDPGQLERLVGAAKLWVHVKYFHPWLQHRADLDWDAAFVAALPKLEAAKTDAEYRAAVTGLLGTLGDPATRVLPAAEAAAAPAAPGGPAAPAAPAGEPAWISRPAPDVAVVHGRELVGPDGAPRVEPAKLTAEAGKARVLVVDLRRGPGDSPFLDYVVASTIDAVAPAYASWPAHRLVVHHGYRTQEGRTSGGYGTAFETGAPPAAHPAAPAGPEAILWVAGEDTRLYDGLLAQQVDGKALIVGPASLGEAAAVETLPLELPHGVTVEIRASEMTMADGSRIGADVVVPARADPLAKAVALARGFVKAKPGKIALGRKARPAPALAAMRLRDDHDWPEAELPARELRLFAAIRLWGIFELFFPYMAYTSDWEGALRDALVEVDAAADAKAYRQALQRQGARSEDGHVGVWPAGLKNVNRAPTVAETRWVEGALTVISVVHPDDAKTQGVAAGDVIVSIDGRSPDNLLAEKWPFTSGSTAEARRQRIAASLLVGDEGVDARLVVRGADGRERSLTLPRHRSYYPGLGSKAKGAATAGNPYRVLDGDIGYVNLMDLQRADVGPMFAALKGTKAIVFDLRGYPNGTAWSIAPVINVKGAPYGAEFLRPEVSMASRYAGTRHRFLQPIPPSPPAGQLYRGKIVVLIDDRAISQSEHTCLFFQEAAGATFVGSPTHGANGDVTTFKLPGGLRGWFTGQEVRHVSGKQLQRVGIQPHILVRPTLAGLRAGKDEVLERALVLVKTGK